MLDMDLPNVSATCELGRRLGSLLFPGSIVALTGQLGAGKTQLSGAIAEGLGIADKRIVTSPTFVLVQEYEGGRLPIFHFDAYRLSGEGEFFDLGPGEYFEANGVCLIEWADRVTRCLPRDHLCVELSVTGPSGRRARLVATGPAHEAVLRDYMR
jgi:tRNA threonylcarbamoyladenosine biosynthesis protein TsaE